MGGRDASACHLIRGGGNPPVLTGQGRRIDTIGGRESSDESDSLSESDEDMSEDESVSDEIIEM